MDVTLVLASACAVLVPTVIFLAGALFFHLLGMTAHVRTIDQTLAMLAGRLPPARGLPEPHDIVIDSNPKACDLGVFGTKVSFTTSELRHLIDELSIENPSYRRKDIISKSQHALDLVNRYRLDHGLGTDDDWAAHGATSDILTAKPHIVREAI